MATTESKEVKLRKLRKRAKGSPDNSHKWWDYARFLAQECKRPAELIRAINRLILLLPEVDFRRKLGSAYMAKGDLAKGVALIKASLAEEILSNVVYEDFRERILQPSRLTQAATSTPSSNRMPPMTFASNS